jgi:hypothetical protein
MFSTSAGSYIRMREHGGFSLEGHLWDAALHLANWLIAERKVVSDSARSVLELGKIGSEQRFASMMD